MTNQRAYIVLRLLIIILYASTFITVMSSCTPPQTYLQVFWKSFVMLSLVVAAILTVSSFD